MVDHNGEYFVLNKERYIFTFCYKWMDFDRPYKAQVLQEFYVATTRMGKKMLSVEHAEEIVNDFAEYPLIQIDRVIISRAMKRHQSKNFSFWDSLIVEAALESGATTLFSEDIHNGLVIGSLTISNPFSCV